MGDQFLKLRGGHFKKAIFFFLLEAKSALCNANSKYNKRNQTSLLCFPGKTR
jgi:hypothetical protein